VLPYSRHPIPHQAMRAAKEVERTLPSPVPGGTSPAALVARPILMDSYSAADFSR
jgi:hypothetical protein